MSSIKLKDKEFKDITQLIFKYAGITMDDRKKPLVEGRLRKRLLALNLDSYNAYYQLLKTDTNHVPEPNHQQLIL